jgi:hypothetical protein
MPQPVEQCGLAFKGRAAFGIVDLGTRFFYGNLTVKLGVDGQIDQTHPATAQPAYDPISVIKKRVGVHQQKRIIANERSRNNRNG